MQTEPSDVRSLLDAVEDSTEGVVAALERLDERGLDAESELSDWTRRMIVAHLSYVATAYRRVSGDALLTGRSMTYPGGAPERTESLHCLDGRTAEAAVRVLRDSSTALQRRWEQVDIEQWAKTFQMDRLGTIQLSRLVALRLTELEIHHGDLGVGYGPHSWSAAFVESCLPLRIAWLAVHHRNRVEADLTICGRWLLRTPERSWLVTASETEAKCVLAEPTTPVDVAISGSAPDLLAFLLGRRPSTPLRVDGMLALFQQFKLAFPGP